MREEVVVNQLQVLELRRPIGFFPGSLQCSGMGGNYVQCAMADLALNFRVLGGAMMKERLTARDPAQCSRRFRDAGAGFRLCAAATLAHGAELAFRVGVLEHNLDREPA